MSFPLGSFTDGLFSGAQNTIQLMGEVQKYNENAATFQDRAQAYKDAIKTNQSQGTQATQPSTALSGSQPSDPKVQIATPPPAETPYDPNAPALTPAVPPGSLTPPAAAPSVTPPPAATPTPSAPPVVTPQAGGYDPATAATPAPAAPAPAAPAKTSALGGTAYTSAGQTQTADASGGKSYTSDAPLVYLPPGQFSAQTRSQAQATQQRAPPSQVTALAGANFPTVGRA